MINKILELPPIIFGCNVLGRTVDKNQAFSLLDALYEQGIRCFDTAYTYGGKHGSSEEILGDWTKKRSDAH